MSKAVKVYLAGAFASWGEHEDWRELVKAKVRGAEWYDPRIHTKQGSIATFVYEDLKGVEQSDVVFYFATNLSDSGAVAECAHGNAHGKLVVLCINEGVQMVHPFPIGISRRLFIGLDAGITYLQNLAETGLEAEFHAIYKTMRDLALGAP